MLYLLRIILNHGLILHYWLTHLLIDWLIYLLMLIHLLVYLLIFQLNPLWYDLL